MSESAITGDEPVSERGAAKRFFAAPGISSTLSISVFHAPQLGHLPSHFGELPPHSVQVKVVLSLAMPHDTVFIASFIAGLSFLFDHERREINAKDAKNTILRLWVRTHLFNEQAFLMLGFSSFLFFFRAFRVDFASFAIKTLLLPKTHHQTK
jgi:hypothetical protein